ncbi:MAG: phosphoribosylamine--glycine ligase, partial [Chlamydiia bacterium]|nr:phosphoribosylamine--glycine ligase [Chlamydiia bacterium]
LKLFGPTKAAAKLESSKAYAKAFMERHGIPTARFEVFTDLQGALKRLPELMRIWGGVAVKPSGLTAGKGVVCCKTSAEAEETLRTLMEERRYGASGETVVLEELLEGKECSVLTITDGTSIFSFPLAQDHKRLLDGDLGPNTGGVGAYTPLPFVREGVEKEVAAKTLEGLKREGVPYCGFLYIGLMLTKEGPKVLEYNCRLGDPEAQVLLPLLESDLAESLVAALEGKLSEKPPRFSKKASCGVVLCSGGYPDEFAKGVPIEGLDAPAEENLFIFCGGVGPGPVTAGGRVLTVVAVAEDLKEATARAYRKAETIRFENRHYRKDIAGAALK